MQKEFLLLTHTEYGLFVFLYKQTHKLDYRLDVEGMHYIFIYIISLSLSVLHVGQKYPIIIKFPACFQEIVIKGEKSLRAKKKNSFYAFNRKTIGFLYFLLL